MPFQAHGDNDATISAPQLRDSDTSLSLQLNERLVRNRERQKLPHGAAMPLGELQESMHVREGMPLKRRRSTQRRFGCSGLITSTLRSNPMTKMDWKNTLHAFAAAGALTCALLIADNARAADYNVGPIHISDPWARATPKGASSGAAYMTIANSGTASDRVNCVSSDISAQCQIHTMTMDNGVMKMRPVEGGLEIKPGETVTLKPSGLHMMLMDLKHALKQGDTVEATLQFDKAGTVKVMFPVAAIGATAPGGNGMMENHGGMMQMKH
jgi:copper(I)-binding protein